MIALVFNLKFIVASALITYQNNHKTGTNRTDYDNYLHDSKLINHIFHESPISYFKILSGIGSESETNVKLLSESNLWFSPHSYIVDYRIVSRVHSVLEFIAQNNEYIHLLFVAFIGTLSLILFVSAFRNYLSRPNFIFGFLGLLLPSILFFSGILSKDYILLFGLSALLYGISTKKWKSIYFWIGLFLLLVVKIYILLTVLISLSIYWIINRFKNRTSFIIILISLFILFSGVFFSPLGNKLTDNISEIQFGQYKYATKGIYFVDYSNSKRDKIYVFNLQDSIYFHRNKEEYTAITDVYSKEISIKSKYYYPKIKIDSGHTFIREQFSYNNANSYIQPNFINFNKLNFIKSIPYALYFTLAQPNLSFVKKLSFLPFILETLLIICFSVFAFVYAFKYNRNTLFSPLCIALFIFVILSAFIVGISGATVGALLRYRLPTYVALIILNFILINPIWKKKSL